MRIIEHHNLTFGEIYDENKQHWGLSQLCDSRSDLEVSSELPVRSKYVLRCLITYSEVLAPDWHGPSHEKQ